jgi:hypothetical protein
MNWKPMHVRLLMNDVPLNEIQQKCEYAIWFAFSREKVTVCHLVYQFFTCRQSTQINGINAKNVMLMVSLLIKYARNNVSIGVSLKDG